MLKTATSVFEDVLTTGLSFLFGVEFGHVASGAEVVDGLAAVVGRDGADGLDDGDAGDEGVDLVVVVFVGVEVLFVHFFLVEGHGAVVGEGLFGFLLLLQTLCIQLLFRLRPNFLLLLKLNQTLIQLRPLQLIQLSFFLAEHAATGEGLVVGLLVVVQHGFLVGVLGFLFLSEFLIIDQFLFLNKLVFPFDVVLVVLIVLVHELRELEVVEPLLEIELLDFGLVVLLVFEQFFVLLVEKFEVFLAFDLVHEFFVVLRFLVINQLLLNLTHLIILVQSGLSILKMVLQ